ncbi:MAG: hypothetical protein KJN80_07515, partial [Deltaproteobacteria bacterium]|nr:hypothetical protein [Deltaproteobacteria bacterium]
HYWDCSDNLTDQFLGEHLFSWVGLFSYFLIGGIFTNSSKFRVAKIVTQLYNHKKSKPATDTVWTLTNEFNSSGQNKPH